MKSFAIVFLVFFSSVVSAQISPPGLGKATDAFWSAIALRQRLNAAGTWQSVSYIGHGRKSNPADNNLFSKNAIWVFNNEVYKGFGSGWRISFALSYRRQSQFYESDGHFFLSDQSYEQEIRYYSRLSKTWQFGRFRLIPTLRQEIRRFYEAGFKEADERLQLRTRFRLQLSADLSRDKVHRIVAGAEALFSGSVYQNGQPHGFGYREARFTIYYSYNPANFPLTLNIGYMNNFIGAKQPEPVNYFCIDLTFNNLFPVRSAARRH